MSIETFDWQGYMSDIGYAPEEIPNEINDEDRQWLYGLWARDLMEQLNYEAKQNPFLATTKEKTNEARKRFLEYAPDLAHYFGEEVQANNPASTFDPEEFRQHVINNPVQNADLGYYLNTFAASRINPDTKFKYPWLEGVTKDQFKKSFMEQQDIDEAWTSVDDIRNGNFGTLAANYQAQLAQQQGSKGEGKSGHIAAFKQGWYEFEKLFGYTVGTLGDATGINWLSDIGNEIAQNIIQKSDAYNYQSKYNQSLADTIKNEGVMAAGGKILNMAEENWATTAAPLALAGIGKILSTYAHVPQPLADAATRAVAANVVRRQGANLLRRASQLAYGSSAALSGLEIGGVRAELEEHGKYDPNNVADVVAAGLVSSSLDFIGNVAAFKGISITASRLWTHKLAVAEARDRLAKEIADNQKKSFTHRVLSAALVEGVTEGLQEIPAMVVGARRDIDYTAKEVRDRIIDAAAVGAFMGGGVRIGEIALEKYHRGDDETPIDIDAEETPDTPDTPETPPQPSQPPPPGFDGEMPLNGVTYRQTEGGFVAADAFNVGYGATHNEAAEDFLKNANKGRVDIDPNDIRSVPASATDEGSSIVRYGNNGQHSIRIIGQGNSALIRKIIDIHNNPKNAVNLQGHNTFNVSDFQSTNPNLNEDQFIRSVLEQKKTGRGSSSDVIANRKNAVDIPVTLKAVPRTDIAGDYAAFNLDNDTRDALRDKGFRVLSNPRTYDNGRRQKLLLYRDGFVYTVTLKNSATDDNVSATVEAEHIKDIVARNQLPKKEQRDKRRQENVKRNALEAGVKEQILRTVSTDAVTDISTTIENKHSITIAPVLRAGFVELSRKTDAEGVSEISIDPRKILEQRVKKANGEIEKIGARGLTYTSSGETTRLDITADGRVVVSTDGRFVGDYFFFDPADTTEGELRASFQSTRIEATQPFHVIEIPDELQFDGRVTFVYEGDASTPKNQRRYYAIRNNGDVHYISPVENNYIERLLALQHVQNLNDARDVFDNQFIEFYALPSFYEDNEVRQFVGFKTENNLLPTIDLEDPTLQQFSNMAVDELISAGYNADFVKVYAIVAPNGEIIRATTNEGVDAFIADIRGYANILDQSEWNPAARGESIFADAYVEPALYTEEDIYGAGYETYPSQEGVTEKQINEDNDKIRETTKRIVDNIGEEIKALRDQYKKGKRHLSDSRIKAYESILSNLERDILFSESSTFNYAPEYYPGGVREINENLRRRLYAMRTAQAMLHIDLYRNKLGSYTNVLNLEELNRVLADTSLTFNESSITEELRENTIQVESIAVRLEEAYIKTFPLNDASKITTLLWDTIYTDPVEGKYGSFINRIHSEGTDFRFSRAAETPRIQRKEAILDELRKELGDFTLNEMLEKGLRGESGGLTILPDQEAAHEIERMFTTDATQPYYDNAGFIQGFVAPDGMIYLVEDGIVDGKARQIILHEYGVHARKFGMTDAQFQEVVQAIKAKRDEKSLEGDFIRHAITRAKQANKQMSENNPIFWEEVAAYAVEDGYHLADTGIIGRIQTWMKKWLWEFGVIDATAFHYQDFVNMAQGMLGNPGPLSFFDGTHDYTKYQDTDKNIAKFSRTILAEDTPEREEFAQRTYRRLRGLDDAIDRERNGEDADTIEQATDWRRNNQGNWEHDQLNLTVPRISEETGITIVSDIAPEKPLPEDLKQFGNYNQFLYSIAWHATPNHVEEFADYLLYLGSGQGSQVHGIGIYAMLGDSEERRLENWRKYGGGDDYDRRDFIENTIRVRNLSSRMNDVKFFNKLGKLYNFDNYSVYELDIPGLDKYYIGFQSRVNSNVTSDYSNSYFITKKIRTVKKGTIEFIDPRERDIAYGDNLTFEEYLSSELLAFNVIENKRTGRTNTSSNSTKNLVGSINRYWLHAYEKGEEESNKFDNLLTSLGLSHDDFFVSEQDINENLPDIGQQYKLNVPDADTEMLQEDKKLNDQPESIKKAIREIWNSIQDSLTFGKDRESYRNFLDIQGMGKHKTAREYYLVLAQALYQIKHGTLQGFRSKSGRSEATIMATQALREAGIKGIHYFGRRDGDCVVIFDGSDIEVLQTYFPPRKGINPKTGEPFRYSRATAEELKPYSSFINTLENDLVSQRISGVPQEGDTVLYRKGDVNEFITTDSLYTIEDAAEYYPDLEQRWIDYHRDDSESNFVGYSRSIPESTPYLPLFPNFQGELLEIAQRQYEEVRNKYFGTDEWLKVRDKETGELIDSALPERLWIQVRTPLFKNWFGDWENDPQNASVVVDEYGEPKVVYHGTSTGGFTEFEGRMWFVDNADVALSYVMNADGHIIKGKDLEKDEMRTLPLAGRYAVFLNIRNPLEVDFSGEMFSSTRISQEQLPERLRGRVISSSYLPTTEFLAQEAEVEGRDGTVFHNIVDPGSYAEEVVGGDDFDFPSATVYVTQNALQVRSATDNTGIYGAGGSRDFRYSRAAATIDDVPQTPRQRGKQVPNAPGMYKMPDGSLHIEPSELPVGFETETILYAAVAISDPAKEEPKLAELRNLIVADPDLRRETDRMMQERNDTNEDHRLGYGVSLILEAYDPASDIYQQTVDAFHEAVSKATGGAYQNLVLDTSQIEAAAHATVGIPYEPFQTAPQETVPSPRSDSAEIERQDLQDAFDNGDAQRQDMQIGEDGGAFISTDDSDVDVIFESKVTNPFDTGKLTDDVLLGTTEHTESDDFYNHLADSPHHGTQEPLDRGRFTARADTIRSEVESFLANVLPEHIWNRMEILWEDNAENRKVLDNALGKFTPKAWQNKNIVICGWNRTFGQVVRTAAREASRFGWNLWQNRDFRKALTDFYDMFTARIYDELRPYYNQMGVTNPAQLKDGQKIFMVQTFFSKLNQSLFTDDQGNMADILGIDAQEYRRILSNVRQGISAQENDLTPFMRGLAGDAELAKQFAQEMLRMTMETATSIGTHFIYERANTLGGKDRIRVYTNEWGTWRRPIANTRYGKVAAQIKENLEWWNERWKGSPRAERFARWMMRNLPMGAKYPMKWFHLYVPDARLGDTTLGKASQLISRVWQRIGDMSGTTIPQDYALMEEIHDILRDHGYDPLVANDMVDQNPNQTYMQFFQSLGITSTKAMEKARLADEVVRTSKQLKKEQAANIRSIIVETGVSLYNRMVNAGVPERYVKRMVNDFENKRQKFYDNYSHRMYEAFTPEGKSELSRMLHYLKRDPASGELTIAKRARNAEEQIRKAEARYGRGTSQFYKATIEARKDLRRYERLMHLWNFQMAVLKEKKRLFGSELNEAVVTAMKNTIKIIVVDSQSIGRIDAQAVPHYNTISAQKARKLDPSKAHHRELMAFLSEIKDPMRVAVYSADQQRQIIAKLQFNKELGEYLVDNNMADIRGIPNSEGIARDLAQMESGTFLEYINVDPEFMPEIKAEWENMQKVTETVLGGMTDAVKANSTVYSLRLAMNNYIGNFSMLLASGHLWRFGNLMEASSIVRKQFLDRFTYGAKDPSDFGKMIIKEMEEALVTGGSGTEMSVFQLSKNAHENFLQMMTGLLYSNNLLTKAGKFKVDNFVKRCFEHARNFYTYGDEWVKPLIYINNRMNAIAKYEAIIKRENGETEEEYKERVLKKAIEEASEMTIRETVSWENSPFIVRQLSTKSTRFFVPDFLLHNFQMLRITASNYVRLAEIWKELRSFNPTDMNPDKIEAYRSALRKELVQRGVGGAMTAGVYAGLAGATGSCMAFIPYMMNTLMAAIKGEDDKDKDNTFFNPQEWEGAQRILNYKTGGDNFFVPAWKHNGKIYAWNYGRASVMLTHAIPQPATENPEFTDYAAQFFKNIVNIGGGTIAQELINNVQGKDKWGRDIGMEAGWGKIFDRVFIPGAVKQLMDMSIGYPGSDNPYREGKAIKMSDAVGIVVNAYDMCDIVNELGWDMGRVNSNAQNVVRKSFVKRLTQSDELSDSDVASMVKDMREDNARHLDRANYLLTGLRQMGMENKDIQHWLTTSRKDAGAVLSKKQAVAFLKGHNVYDDALVTYLRNRRNDLAKGASEVRMSREELATVLQNYDRAIRIYSQALRAQ